MLDLSRLHAGVRAALCEETAKVSAATPSEERAIRALQRRLHQVHGHPERLAPSAKSHVWVTPLARDAAG